MIKSGLTRPRIRHRNYDLHKSFGLAVATSLPAEFNTDAGVDMPDQNQINTQFIPAIPALPEGCTDYGQSELGTDLLDGKVIRNPFDLEEVTHANALGGIDIDTSLLAAKKLGWFTGFYQIKYSGILDAFDALRVAQYSVYPTEKRSITFGTPWFPSWEAKANGNTFTVESNGTFTVGSGIGVPNDGILPMPSDQELAMLRANPDVFSWHNSKLSGWKTINGVPVYADKSWQGKNVGDNGWLYMPREVINVVMALPSVVAYTATNLTPTSVQTIDLSVIQTIVSFIKGLLGL